jgi:hypothetical protein
MHCLVLPVALTLLLGATSHVPDAPPVQTHDQSFSKEGLFKANVATLKDTHLVAQPEVPIPPDTNVLWCGTLQLVWNKAIDLVGEKLHFISQPPVVDLLNQEDFTSADLDPSSYVALADFWRNDAGAKIRAALEKTFHGAASPELIPQTPPHPGPYDFVAYAYLYKNLAFAQPFESNDPLTFGSTQVKNFGFEENKKQLPDDLFDQVAIYDYQSPDDFIIKLTTKSPNDELILAKVTPGATLQATMDAVLKRMTLGNPETAQSRDTLAVPKLNFDLLGNFPALEGLVLKPSPTAQVRNLITSEVKQLVRFQLNEKGAILKSEAVMTMTGSAMISQQPPPHVMIFDKPFLILMKQSDSAHPYFALWVGNATLLVHAN